MTAAPYRLILVACWRRSELRLLSITPANRAADPKSDPLQWVQPAQVAALLLHLASDAGAQVTGAAIPIYGRQV